tara:strand:- start:515 stop:733 length:219 start_codon:yes stop_codon:yes gene_type:complete
MIEMNESIEKYIAQALEGYETNLNQIEMALPQYEEQLKTIQSQKKEMEDNIVELRSILGLSEATSTLKKVED